MIFITYIFGTTGISAYFGSTVEFLGVFSESSGTKIPKKKKILLRTGANNPIIIPLVGYVFQHVEPDKTRNLYFRQGNIDFAEIRFKIPTS